MRFVLAGDLEEDRSFLKRKLQKLGAEVGSVVTADTDALFAGRHPKQSKTDKAEELGVPVLGIVELRRLLDMGSFESAIAAPEEAPDDDRTPFPTLSTMPREGEYVGHHPSGSIRVRGPRVGGLSHGTWTYFHDNGEVSDVIRFERGLRVGDAVGFHEDGTKKYVGAYLGGHQHGPWEWWYPSGAWKQRYIYDEQGKTHGPYAWDQEGGSPRARGAFWHGTRDGNWEWHAEPNYERTIRGYHRAMNHGHEAGWYPGSQLAYSRHWDMSQRVGEWVEHYPSGAPKLRCTYEAGYLVGEHRAWDESGNETITQYVDGLRQSILDDEALQAKVVAKVKRVTSQHKKRDSITEAVEYSESGPFMLHLWRSGQLDLEAIPSLWEGLRNEPFRPGEVMTFLSNVGEPALKKAHTEFLPCWPRDLDALVCHAYAREPKSFEGWQSLPAHSKIGVAFVLARAGVEREQWAEVLAPCLGDLVRRHVHDYGLGERVWWWVDGQLEEVELYERLPEKQHRRQPLPRFYELVEFFGDRETWAKAVIRESLKHTKKENRAPWESARDGLPLATRKQLEVMLGKSGYEPAVEDVFLEVRNDDADFLEALAVSVKPGRRKVVALCAAKKRLDAGEPISDALLDAIELDVGTYSNQWIDQTIQKLPLEDIKHDPAIIDASIDFRELRRGFTTAALMFEVFGRLPAAQQRAKLEAVLNSQYGKTAAVPFLPFVDDEALWKRGIAAVQTAEDRSERAAIGLAMLPSRALPLLVDAHARASKKMKESFGRAILGMMARMSDAGESWPPEHDSFIRTDVPAESYQYEYGQRFLRKIVHRLAPERAKAVMMRMLDRRRVDGFARAFRFVGSHPTPALVRHAMVGLLEVEFPAEHHNSISAGLRSLDDRRELVAWFLRNGGNANLTSALERAVGSDAWKKLQEDLRNEVADETDGLDPIERLIRDAGKVVASSMMSIYALRPVDAAPDAGSLNVRYGAAPGVGADRWPTLDGKPMVHLVTIDLESIAMTRYFRGRRAVSLFISDPDENRAWGPENAHTELVFSGPDELASSCEPPEGVELRDAASFEVIPIDVPSDLFGSHSALRTSVYRLGARAGGKPIWLHDDEGVNARFIMQFDERFVGVNLGDGGVMYVFDDTAFRQRP